MLYSTNNRPTAMPSGAWINRTPQNAPVAANAAAQKTADYCVADPKNQQLLGDLPIGMSYVPSQKWHKLFDPDEAMRKGTMFQELNLPFLGGGGAREGYGYGR